MSAKISHDTAAIELLGLLAIWRKDDNAAWWKIAGACKNSGAPYEAFEAWSLTDRHGDRKQIRRAWDNNKSRAGIGTLAHMAAEDGKGDEAKHICRMIDKGAASRIKRSSAPTPPPKIIRPEDGEAVFQKLIAPYSQAGEPDLWEASPRRLMDEPAGDWRILLNELYRPDDFLFLGGKYGKGVFTVREWLTIIERNGTGQLPHIIPNTLTGEPAETSDGKLSKRCDAAVRARRFAVIEFDKKPREEQARFWLAMLAKGVPVAAIIDSAGASLHGWVCIDAPDEKTWRDRVEEKLFRRILEPLGVDGQCKSDARLSRLPGHYRDETKPDGRKVEGWQRLLYFNPEARAV